MATPKIPNAFKQLERSIQLGGTATNRAMEKASVHWFTNNAVKGNQRTSVNEEDGTLTVTGKDYIRHRQGIKTEVVPGQLFIYNYDPKHKATLPYYDRYPMTLVIDLYEDGWLGLNLHYLPPIARARLLGLIMGTMQSEKLSREAKARVTYDLVKGATQWNLAIPAIKRYLAGHVASKIVRVPPNEWTHAVMLPTASWAKANENHVYAQSMQKIKDSY